MSRFSDGRIRLFFLALMAWACASEPFVSAGEQALAIATETTVSEDGRVHLVLTLRNRAGHDLYQIHPMFHFHHETVHGRVFDKLTAGESLRIENDRHPPVMRVGRYPLLVMVNYKESRSETGHQTQMHTDSFYYREPLDSEVVGEIRADEASAGPYLRVAIRNRSPGMKNIQLMLHLPPGLTADTFRNMVGFTLRGDEEKRFEIPLSLADASLRGEFPVHLMIEYGEMTKHFSGEARGTVRLGMPGGLLWAHLFAFFLFCLALYGARMRRVSPAA